MKIFDQAAARTGLRDHEAAAAGFDPVTVGSEADDHKAYYPGSHRITMRVTGDRATGRLLGMQLFGHKNAEIAKRIDIAATAIFHQHDRRRDQRPGPVLHPAAGQPLGSGPDGRPGLGPGHPAALTRPGSSRRGTAMSGHNRRPGPQPHHTRHPAIRAAAAAIILLALAACGSTTTTPATSTAATASPSGGPGTLTGAGSTYVAPFFALAFARYHQQHPAVTVNYSPVGSSAGIAAISARQVNFGASDVPMNASEQAAAKGGPITQVPDALGAEGVAYNLDLPAGARLHLTGPVLAAHLPRPDHPLERPGHHRPQPRHHPPGRVDHRRAPLRRQRHHLHLQQLPVQRRPRLGGQGRHRQDAALAGRGRRRRQRQRDLHGVPHPLLHRIRRAGLFPGPGPAVRRHPQPGRELRPPVHPDRRRRRRPETRHHPDRLLHRQPARRQQLPHQRVQLGAVYTHQPSQARGQALVSMLDWLTHDGQAYAAANGYVPLPAQVRQLALTMLQQVTGPAGTHLLS